MYKLIIKPSNLEEDNLEFYGFDFISEVNDFIQSFEQHCNTICIFVIQSDN